ncbi:hypothetical protein WN55_11419 [Dufourea novaeangliae]|uniref:Copia protein n=1 Tax=Dufourea novaeangliae TaxID=178035 RepID=A0A154PAI7_DUFNO|nr:hypothetical protein WN55_11419 [Dufourea novaeangliae]
MVGLNLTEIEEPQSLWEALSSLHAKNWEDAMQEEIENLERLQIWKAASAPPSKTCIGSKWVFKIKTLVMRKATSRDIKQSWYRTPSDRR